MSDDARQVIIERIIETNYYLTQAVLKGDKNRIIKYKAELDNLIAFVIEQKK
jgi:hypothetical protein